MLLFFSCWCSILLTLVLGTMLFLHYYIVLFAMLCYSSHARATSLIYSYCYDVLSFHVTTLFFSHCLLALFMLLHSSRTTLLFSHCFSLFALLCYLIFLVMLQCSFRIASLFFSHYYVVLNMLLFSHCHSFHVGAIIFRYLLMLSNYLVLGQTSIYQHNKFFV